MKAEAQKQKEMAESGIDTEVPEGFGMPQKDAETFKPVVLKSKKRKLEDISGGPAASGATEEENKHKKVE
jgi:hypothetical protein